MAFKKGVSGNPGGRKRGTTDKRTALRDLLQPHAADLVKKAVDLAKAGDTTALRICIDRCIPAMKAKDEPVELPALTGSPAEQGEKVMRAMADGVITPDQAYAIMQVLAAQVKIVEADELEKRIAALEGKEHGNQQSKSTH